MTEPQADQTKAAIARLRSTVRAAVTVAPMLVRLFPHARSAVEIGCESAAWLTMLERHGVADILGVDGARHPRLHVGDAQFRRLDPAEPFTLGRTFDLALSLGLADRVPVERGPGLVADLCAAADVVVFSAAMPGDSEAVHARLPSTWAYLFAAHGYDCVDCLRPLIWTDSRVDWRYSQALMCFIRAERLPTLSELEGIATVPETMRDLVHPLARPAPPPVPAPVFSPQSRSGS